MAMQIPLTIGQTAEPVAPRAKRSVAAKVAVGVLAVFAVVCLYQNGMPALAAGRLFGIQSAEAFVAPAVPHASTRSAASPSLADVAVVARPPAQYVAIDRAQVATRAATPELLLEPPPIAEVVGAPERTEGDWHGEAAALGAVTALTATVGLALSLRKRSAVRAQSAGGVELVARGGRLQMSEADAEAGGIEDVCDADAPPPPTLAGEKIAFSLIAAGVAAGVWYAGLGAVVARIGSSAIVMKAFNSAFRGGLSGAIAGVIQVCTLMWLRTTMNYQYRYGTSTKEAMKKLYEEGGIARFYQGVTFAIFQTPLARFGDTAANTGVLELLAMTAWGAGLPMATQTAMASAAGSLWRIAITPIDTFKTTLQVEGPKAVELLKTKVQCEGPTVLYQGALANALANFLGSFPWFFTFNLCMKRLPMPAEGAVLFLLLRTAVSGVCASCVSDCISNVLRVLKTTRQTSSTSIGYVEAIKQIVEKDGYKGLFARGLGTRLITNAIQASMFTVVWKYLEMQMKA